MNAPTAAANQPQVQPQVQGRAPRRAVLQALAAGWAVQAGVGFASDGPRPAGGLGTFPADLLAAINQFTGGQPLQWGRVQIEVAELVDNGNVVPVTLQVLPPPSVSASAVSRLHGVAALALFNERNPQREVIEAHFGPLSGRAQFSTRVRLATTQRLVAVAKMQDGQCWYSSAQVIVTLAACIESDD